VLRFDAPTDRAGLRGAFACAELLDDASVAALGEVRPLSPQRQNLCRVR